ncbi:MAG: hypothetical protein RLZZ297_1675 [Chloroflexota bacterium]
MTALAATLAQLVCATDPHGYPAATIAKMQTHLLDTLGVSIAGSQAPETQLLLRALSLHKARSGQAAVWGTELWVDRRSAALINGVAAHAYELDDSGGCDHSGAVVVPALVAWASRRSRPVSGSAFLHACIMGYEVGRRVLEACGGYEAHNERGWHSTGTCGVFGAATAVAVAQGLDTSALTATLGIAASGAAGNWSFIHDGSQTKKLHAGRAAEAGYLAAQLAQSGYSGPATVFDAGSWGNFFTTYAGESAVPAALTDDYGARWRVDRCSLKPYATCRGTHAGIDALGMLLAAHDLQPADIATIHVDISPFQYGMCGATRVTTRAEAQMSLPYALAARLVYGKVFLAELADGAWATPAIADWLARTTVHSDASQAADAEPLISITTRAGATHRLRVDEPLGSPGRPLPAAAVTAKFTDLVTPVLGAAAAQSICAAVAALPTSTDIAPLIGALSTPTTQRGTAS